MVSATSRKKVSQLLHSPFSRTIILCQKVSSSSYSFLDVSPYKSQSISRPFHAEIFTVCFALTIYCCLCVKGEIWGKYMCTHFRVDLKFIKGTCTLKCMSRVYKSYFFACNFCFLCGYTLFVWILISIEPHYPVLWNSLKNVASVKGHSESLQLISLVIGCRVSLSTKKSFSDRISMLILYFVFYVSSSGTSSLIYLRSSVLGRFLSSMLFLRRSVLISSFSKRMSSTRWLYWNSPLFSNDSWMLIFSCRSAHSSLRRSSCLPRLSRSLKTFREFLPINNQRQASICYSHFLLHLVYLLLFPYLFQLHFQMDLFSISICNNLPQLVLFCFLTLNLLLCFFKLELQHLHLYL